MTTNTNQDSTEDLREQIAQLVDRAKGYGYPMTTNDATDAIMSLFTNQLTVREKHTIPDDLVTPIKDMFDWVHEHSSYFEDTYGGKNFAVPGSVDWRIQEFLEQATLPEQERL
jgi:hypothetical protein